MNATLLNSLLELAHATSQNLGFAHRSDVNISYGEETITETNLLELRRRHPMSIVLHTFTKPKEAATGADWEWRIIGNNRAFHMRVQAKRLRMDDKLSVVHTVASSGRQQIDLLIADAKLHGLMPVYCLYSSEKQRKKWKTQNTNNGFVQFEYGCLLADANKVKSVMPKKLADIEKYCVPWHYLVDRSRYSKFLQAGFIVEGSTSSFVREYLTLEEIIAKEDTETKAVIFPTLQELNAVERPEREIEGLIEADSPKYRKTISADGYRERGISLLLEINVADASVTHELH